MPRRRVACDKCGARDKLTSWFLGRSGDRPRTLTLCPTHAEPLEEIVELRPASRRRPRLYTLDEIEMLKNEQHSTP